MIKRLICFPAVMPSRCRRMGIPSVPVKPVRESTAIQLDEQTLSPLFLIKQKFERLSKERVRLYSFHARCFCLICTFKGLSNHGGLFLGAPTSLEGICLSTTEKNSDFHLCHALSMEEAAEISDQLMAESSSLTNARSTLSEKTRRFG